MWLRRRRLGPRLQARPGDGRADGRARSAAARAAGPLRARRRARRRAACARPARVWLADRHDGGSRRARARRRCWRRRAGGRADAGRQPARRQRLRLPVGGASRAGDPRARHVRRHDGVVEPRLAGAQGRPATACSRSTSCSRGMAPMDQSADKLAAFIDEVRSAPARRRCRSSATRRAGCSAATSPASAASSAVIDDIVGLAPSSHGTTNPLAPPLRARSARRAPSRRPARRS